jgi:hypothetical protein
MNARAGVGLANSGNTSASLQSVSEAKMMVRKSCGAFLLLLLSTGAAHAQDAINLSQVTVYNSPTDVASWPVTTKITQIVEQPTNSSAPGMTLTFSALNTWPDYTPPGWDGPLQYTVWPVVKINGQWYTSGIIQMWNGRGATGAPLLTDFAINWVYDGRWGPMQGHQPVVGEQMGFFVTAGNARGVNTVTSVRERSNVVMINVPAGDTGAFKFKNLPPGVMTFNSTTGAWALQTFDDATGFTNGQTGAWTPGWTVLPADMNGDGLIDFFLYNTTTGVWYEAITQSDGTFMYFSGVWAAGWTLYPGDFNGDGRTDFFLYKPSTGAYYLVLASGVGFVYPQNGTYLPNWNVTVADINGDGRSDVFLYNSTSGVWYELITQGGGASFTYVSGAWTPGWSVNKGDFNGDGRPDFFLYNSTTGAWYFALNTGVGSFSYQGGAWTAGWQVTVGDFNGDKRSDLIIFNPGTGAAYEVTNGPGFNLTYYAIGLAAGWSILPGDFNNDGRTDLILYNPSTGVWYQVLATATAPNFTVQTGNWGTGNSIIITGK